MSDFDILPPFSAEEYARLKDDIAENGQRVTIITDQGGNVIDGHHRQRILRELGVPKDQWKIEVQKFASDDERIVAVLSLNVHRRHLMAADRRVLAGQLATMGWTQERIAVQLGVSQSAIQRDLDGFTHVGKPPRPKGGRPKSPLKPRARKYSPATEQAAASAVLDEGKGVEKVARELGVSEQVVIRQVEREKGRREIKADPPIDPATLPMSGRKKFDAAIRQHKKNLDREFDERVRREVLQHTEAYLKMLNEREAKAAAVLKARTGVFTGYEYKLIQSCLHPDGERSKERLHKAFQSFTARKLVLLREADEPTRGTDLPKTWQEMMQRKAEVQAARKAARAAKKAGSVSP